MTKSSCHRCHSLINDKEVALQVGNTIWHPNCLRCNVCGDALQERCYVRKNVYYCRKDFHSLFGPKCHGCQRLIAVDDLVRQIHSRFYHSNCLVCDVCTRPIVTGEQLFIVNQNRYLCKMDFEIYATEKEEIEDDESAEDNSVVDPEEEVVHQENSILTSHSPVQALQSSNATTYVQNPTYSYTKMESEVTYDVGDYVTQPKTTHDQLTERNDEDLGSRNRLSSVTSVESRGNEMDSDSVSEKSDDILAHSKQYDDDVPIIAVGKDATDDDDASIMGIKRRGPRTTIKAKQLEILKSAFQSSPKPARHTRELLARETGLNMRVIQVWFQNRRSKERRMKQINALNLRRRQGTHVPPMFGYSRNRTNDHVVPDWTSSIQNDYTSNDVDYRDILPLRPSALPSNSHPTYSSHPTYVNNAETFAYPITPHAATFPRHQPPSYDNGNHNNRLYPEIINW